jgi:RNA polymerase sigma-70 factor (ECF subfamily)
MRAGEISRLVLWLPWVALAACRQGPPAITTETSAAAETATAVAAAPAAAATSAPQAIAFDPPLDATGVDPARTTLSVTFDRAMDREGWAWVIESSETAPEIGDSAWDAATRTNTAQVRLAPGRTYVVWINSPSYLYFRAPAGQPLEPVRWTFSTASPTSSAPASPPVEVAPVASH